MNSENTTRNSATGTNSKQLINTVNFLHVNHVLFFVIALVALVVMTLAHNAKC